LAKLNNIASATKTDIMRNLLLTEIMVPGSIGFCGRF
jgi:hypothetical protein